jgi:Ca-activated chloride channel family protein
MRNIFIILLILAGASSFAQVTASTTSFDFGELYSGSQTYTDITFKNTSGKTQFLLTINKPQDVYYIYSGKRILPDSSITIRLKINERRKGRFNYYVDVYFSEPRDPIAIKLSGTVKETASSNSMTDCPDFNSSPPAYQATSFDVTIRVIDSITRVPIKSSKVYIVENGQLVGEFQTNNKGIVRKRIPLGYYYITAQKPPYRQNYHEGYLNFKRNFVEIELAKDPPMEVVPPPEIPVEIVEDTIVVEDPPIEEVPPPVVEEPVVEVDTTSTSRPPEIVNTVEKTTLDQLPDTVFTDDYFKYSNITFILDVSTSMAGMGKLDLMKMSMIELAKILRKDDIISMIKYSSEVETILKGVHGDLKEDIISVVQSLKYSGMTAGGDAIKSAYKLNKKTYIPGGNNMVIMITDGVFNKGDKNYLKTIEKNYNAMGIKFSVVGIKTSDFITKHMLNVVSHGGGDFIRILTVADARTKLINEIKRSSFKFD